MEQTIEVRSIPRDIIPMTQVIAESTAKPFIEANTVEVSFKEIQENHIIPVFVKDNEPLISHGEFIEAVNLVVRDYYHGETVSGPAVRVSHPIKGRIPEAKDKPAAQLLDREKTLYYERMAFVIEIPSIMDIVGGNPLSLTIGGVKAYNTDNLYSRSISDQHFKLFAGFQNKVCTNLCVWSDGYVKDVTVRTVGQLKGAVRILLETYQPNYHLSNLKMLPDYSITESQFAHLIGKCRMYPQLPIEIRNQITPMQFGDQQMGTVVKDFYKHDSFCRDAAGNINLWKLYNLFTGSNKASYIDSFLDRSVNAFTLLEHLRYALRGEEPSWYLE